MPNIADITLMEWIIMIAVFVLIGGAYWLIQDSRKRGMQIGGKACGGCPHYCQIGRNCDGTPKPETTASCSISEHSPKENA